MRAGRSHHQPGPAAGLMVAVARPCPCVPKEFSSHSAAHPLQGDTEASTFYVLERGAADVRIHKEEWGEERKVHTYQPGR